MKKTVLSGATVALLILSLGLLKAGQANAAAAAHKTESMKYEVKIDNFSFGPATLTVPAGATVTWTNNDDVPHTIVSSQGHVLKSQVLDTDEKFSFTFTEAGTYPYYCSVHPRMVGKVIVQ